jgi:hypothetical protein
MYPRPSRFTAAVTSSEHIHSLVMGLEVFNVPSWIVLGDRAILEAYAQTPPSNAALTHATCTIGYRPFVTRVTTARGPARLPLIFRSNPPPAPPVAQVNMTTAAPDITVTGTTQTT